MDILGAKFIPPFQMLLLWRGELNRLAAMANETPYVFYEDGVLDRKAVDLAIKISEAKATKASVRAELEWLNGSRLLPRSVLSHPPQTTISEFKAMILDQPANFDVPGAAMTPGELAQLCCKRYLSGDHMHWFVDKLNTIQTDAFCVYLNRVSNPHNLLGRHFNSKPWPSRLTFICNIGRRSDGRCFLGDDANLGSHWTLAVLDLTTNVVSYGDSMGWLIPEGLFPRLQQFTEFFGQTLVPDLKYCHDPSMTDNAGRHACGNTCTNYPHQKCSNVCGPTVIIMMAISAVCPSTFQRLTSIKQKSTPYCFLSEPSKYNKYLRFVLMSWITEGAIKIEYITPQCQQDSTLEAESDSDDDCHLPRVQARSSEVSKRKEDSAKQFPCTECPQVSSV